MVIQNCQSNPDQCVEFECDVRQLQGPGSAQVTVTAYLDGRYFAVSVMTPDFVATKIWWYVAYLILRIEECIPEFQLTKTLIIQNIH